MDLKFSIGDYVSFSFEKGLSRTERHGIIVSLIDPGPNVIEYVPSRSATKELGAWLGADNVIIMSFDGFFRVNVKQFPRLLVKRVSYDDDHLCR